MASVPKKSQDLNGKDLIDRSNKNYNNAATLTFVGLRPLAPVVQYGILAQGYGSALIKALGLETLPAGLPNTGTVLDRLGLSPYRLILLGMSVGAAAKQIYWLTAVAQEHYTPGMVSAVVAANTVLDSFNSLLFTCSLTSASLSSSSQFPQSTLLVGGALYVTGIFLEVFSEHQRKVFKKKPENKGKAYTGGLWKFSRHINYAGFTLWRTGFALAAGGWIWATLNGALLSYDFLTRAIPLLETYCSERYGLQWTEYERQTPYTFLPFVY